MYVSTGTTDIVNGILKRPPSTASSDPAAGANLEKSRALGRDPKPRRAASRDLHALADGWTHGLPGPPSRLRRCPSGASSETGAMGRGTNPRPRARLVLENPFSATYADGAAGRQNIRPTDSIRERPRPWGRLGDDVSFLLAPATRSRVLLFPPLPPRRRFDSVPFDR